MLHMFSIVQPQTCPEWSSPNARLESPQFGMPVDPAVIMSAAKQTDPIWGQHPEPEMRDLRFQDATIAQRRSKRRQSQPR